MKRDQKFFDMYSLVIGVLATVVRGSEDGIDERRERMGVSHLLEHMVFKGTARRSARDIALSLECVGGSLDAYTSREHTVYQARVLDEHLPLAADVIGDMVFDPALNHADLTLERNVVLEEIAMVEDNPQDLVHDVVAEAVFAGHPLGRPVLQSRVVYEGGKAGPPQGTVRYGYASPAHGQPSVIVRRRSVEARPLASRAWFLSRSMRPNARLPLKYGR